MEKKVTHLVKLRAIDCKELSALRASLKFSKPLSVISGHLLFTCQETEIWKDYLLCKAEIDGFQGCEFGESWTEIAQAFVCDFATMSKLPTLYYKNY